ncbi:MAG TPA: hypothetical protein VNS32_13005, partial [Flavisolibacter sp.]|nr:hypothetical protein [Flavisolibacter sp.]
STIDGMVAGDFDGDGNLDVVMNTNDYGTEVSVGRYDALNGLFLKGNGKGGFTAETIQQSGIYIPGNGKALIALKGADNKCLIAAGQNRGPLKVFQPNKQLHVINIQPSDISALITYMDGKKQKQEFYYGASFLSQSSRFLQPGDKIRSIEILDNKGSKRTVLSR